MQTYLNRTTEISFVHARNTRETVRPGRTKTERADYSVLFIGYG